ALELRAPSTARVSGNTGVAGGKRRGGLESAPTTLTHQLEIPRALSNITAESGIGRFGLRSTVLRPRELGRCPWVCGCLVASWPKWIDRRRALLRVRSGTCRFWRDASGGFLQGSAVSA